uniref:Uncharacterized protein n=1 Tax=Rhipicephalus microplus TaxID=6941 RepID=A0A6G5AGG2_RHIMP
MEWLSSVRRDFRQSVCGASATRVDGLLPWACGNLNTGRCPRRTLTSGRHHRDNESGTPHLHSYALNLLRRATPSWHSTLPPPKKIPCQPFLGQRGSKFGCQT